MKIPFNKFTCRKDYSYKGAFERYHYRKGYKIATNGTILIAVKDNYDESLEGMSVKKSAKNPDAKTSTLPPVKPLLDYPIIGTYTIDIETLKSFILGYQEETEFEPVLVKIGDVIYNAKKIYPALELMLAYKICNFQLTELNPKTFAMRVELPNSDGIMLIMSAPFYKGDIIQYTLKVHRVEEN